MKKTDSLGDRIKSNYEDRFRFLLPRRTYTIIRLDGKAFHNFTKSCDKPYDYNLMTDINQSVCALCGEIQGAAFAYCQSDEVSVLLTDFKKITTEAWFNGNIQKIVSVSASILTAAFNDIVFNQRRRAYAKSLAYFDSRVFVIPDIVEVENYFIWRQKDAIRNSISMAAQYYFSEKELDSKDCDERQCMLLQKGVDWEKYPAIAKQGRIIKKGSLGDWVVAEPPIFTQKRDYLQDLINLAERED